MAEVEKENPKKAAKNMTEAESDALKILSKTTEVAEAPIAKDMREGELGGVTLSTHMQWRRCQKKL